METEKEEQIRTMDEDEQQEDDASLVLRKSRNVIRSDVINDEIIDNASVNEHHPILSDFNMNIAAAAANGVANKHDQEKEEEKEEEEEEISGIDDEKTKDEEEELVVVDANGSEEIKNSPSLVFYEKDEGLWKCRICTWTYGNGSVSVDHFQNHRNGQMHFKQMMMNFKTLKFESEEKQVQEDSAPHELDSSSSNNSTVKEYERHENGSSSNIFVLHQNNSTVNKYEIHLENGRSSGPGNILPSKSLFQEKHTSNGSSKEIESAEEVELINEDEVEVEEVDLDVENVLKKQTTHDLYCPNCNSCITRRVILRKRKRRTTLITSDTEEEIKRNKVEGGVGAVQQVSSGEENHQVGFDDTSTQTPPRADEEPDVFRCLACFSFFIPRWKGGKENVRGGEQQESRSKKNWFTYMFASNNQETHVVQDVGMADGLAQDEAHTASEQSNKSSSENANKQDVQLNQESKRTQLTTENLSQLGGSQLPISSSHKGEYSEQDGALSEDKDALQKQQLLPSSFPAAHDMDGLGTTSISVSAIPPHDDDDDDDGQRVGAYVLTHSIVENKTPSFLTSETGQVYPYELSQHTITDAKYEVHTGETLNFVDNFSSVTGVSVTQGKDTVITIDSQHAATPQILQGITTPTASASALVSSGTQTLIRGRETVEERKGIEVIKSIVYGGLAESITSLSVVSSAAGGGAATLKILALGMANLIGGLFIICHNLWELRSDRVEQVSNQITDEVTNHRDRYKELLGRRDNFILHAVVAIISYLIFGLLPPLVYGFSFRTSNDKEFKLLCVAAASFLCVMILAIGKAYVQRRPKPYIKTVSTYVILGFMVSGVSYAAGILVERLLQELAPFDPTTSGSNGTLSYLLVPQTKSAPSGWSSH